MPGLGAELGEVPALHVSTSTCCGERGFFLNFFEKFNVIVLKVLCEEERGRSFE